MRKISLLLASFFALGTLVAQPVADNAIIPVSVTLNSILRLNVTSGGNIEFIVNTLQQYENGVANSDRYTTTFTVASSVDFDVALYAEDANFIGSDNASVTMSLDNLGYTVESAGTGADGTDWNLIGAGTTVQAVTNASSTKIIESISGEGAGDVTKNKFQIKWRLGTKEGNMNTVDLMKQNLTSDRYTTNIFLALTPQ